MAKTEDTTAGKIAAYSQIVPRDTSCARYTDQNGAQYIEVCPRGFINEKTIYQIPREKISEAEAAFANFEDDVEAHRYTNWLTSKPDLDNVLPWGDCPASAGWQ
jgi:hypothetical protein